jgi:hypothetical protein
MENNPPPQGMRLCPTRVDLEDTLFAHLITQDVCQERQRGHYHKCPTCKHLNERLASAAPTADKKEAV